MSWQTHPLEDCIEDVSYTNKIQRTKFMDSGRFPVVSQEDGLVNGYWNDAGDLFKLTRPLVVFGDHTRAIKYVDFDFVLGADGVKLLQPKMFLEPKFFYYQLQSVELPSLGYARHYRLLRRQSLCVPPLAEQHRIVALLDEAFAGIVIAKTNAENSLRNARDVCNCASQEILDSVGGVEMSLESVAAGDCTLSYGIVQPGDDVENGLPVVRPVDLTREVIALDGLKRIDPELATSYQRTRLQGGELLLCVRGTTGTVSVASPELEGANVTRGIVPIRFKPDFVAASFGYHLMKSAGVQSQIREKTYGTALMQINIGDLRSVSVKIPSLTKQRELAERLDSLRQEGARLQSLYARKFDAIDELKQSLLQQAFSGQL